MLDAGFTNLDHVGTQAVLVANRVHVLFQIQVEKLEHEIQLGIRVNNVEKPETGQWQQSRCRLT